MNICLLKFISQVSNNGFQICPEQTILPIIMEIFNNVKNWLLSHIKINELVVSHLGDGTLVVITLPY
jgi:hypothetical protein